MASPETRNADTSFDENARLASQPSTEASFDESAREGSRPEHASQPAEGTSFVGDAPGPAPVTPIMKGGWQPVPVHILQPDNELLEENRLVGLGGRGSIRAVDGPMLGRTDESKAALAPETKTRPLSDFQPGQANDVWGRDGSPPIAPASTATPRKKARLSPGPGFVEKSDVRNIRTLDTRNTALVDGVWQSDGSQHASKDQMMPDLGTRPSVRVAPRKGMRTLKVAYFFSGLHRKASIADHLRTMCRKSGFGLDFWEIDILVGGKAHDLMAKEAQDAWLSKIEEGHFNICICSPPCGTWSRSNWANDSGPQP